MYLVSHLSICYACAKIWMYPKLGGALLSKEHTLYLSFLALTTHPYLHLNLGLVCRGCQCVTTLLVLGFRNIQDNLEHILFTGSKNQFQSWFKDNTLRVQCTAVQSWFIDIRFSDNLWISDYFAKTIFQFTA